MRYRPGKENSHVLSRRPREMEDTVDKRGVGEYSCVFACA